MMICTRSGGLSDFSDVDMKKAEILVVPKRGLEPPPPLRGLDPESSASANSATSAQAGRILGREGIRCQLHESDFLTRLVTQPLRSEISERRGPFFSSSIKEPSPRLSLSALPLPFSGAR